MFSICFVLNKIETNFSLARYLSKSRRREEDCQCFGVMLILSAVVPVVSIIPGANLLDTHVIKPLKQSKYDKNIVAYSLTVGLFLVLGLGVLLFLIGTLVTLGRQIAKLCGSNSCIQREIALG